MESKKASVLRNLRAPFLATVVGGGLSVACGPEVTVNPPEPIVEPVCPSEAPTAGELCSFPGANLNCGYDWCGDSHATIDATCAQDGTWSLIHTSCNPPYPADAGEP